MRPPQVQSHTSHLWVHQEEEELWEQIPEGTPEQASWHLLGLGPFSEPSLWSGAWCSDSPPPTTHLP